MARTKNEQNTDPKEQTEDHQHAAKAAKERSEKSPELKMGVQTPMARTGPEMRPRCRPADQRGARCKE